MKYLNQIAAMGIILSAVTAMTAGCAHSPDFNLQPGMTLSADEARRGRVGSELLQEAVRPYADDRLAGYVDSVLRRILAALPENRIVFRVTILDSADTNAYAFSNGHIFICRNMLAYLNSESELAGLLAHEVGHIVLRHDSRERKRREQMTALAHRMESNGATSQMRDVTESFGEAMTQGYSRQMEIEADRFAVSVLPKAGYNPLGVLKLLEVIAHMAELDLQLIRRMGMNPLLYKGVFNSHPYAAIRVQVVRRDLGHHPSHRNIGQNDRNRYLQTVAGLVVGPHAADGLIRHSQYMGGPYGVSFKLPVQWAHRLIPGNGLVAWPAQPDPSDGTYFRFFALEKKAPAGRPAKSAHSSDVRVTFDHWGKIEEKLVNGLKMRFSDAQVANDHRPARLAVVIGHRADFVFQLINATADAKAVLNRTLESLQEIGDQNVRALEDNHIAIAMTGPGGAFEPLGRTSQTPMANDIATMQFNGFFDPGSGPKAGDLVKWIR